MNRGVAAYDGRLYLGALDGRLIALDAATGKEVWSVVTVDQSKAYTITGAPRVIQGKVIIGNGGAEFGVRGYLKAWDPVTQRAKWTVEHSGAWNGGILSTAGNLVFQGNVAGELVAYDATNGTRLWSFPAQTGIVAAPATYAADRGPHRTSQCRMRAS